MKATGFKLSDFLFALWRHITHHGLPEELDVISGCEPSVLLATDPDPAGPDQAETLLRWLGSVNDVGHIWVVDGGDCARVSFVGYLITGHLIEVVALYNGPGWREVAAAAPQGYLAAAELAEHLQPHAESLTGAAPGTDQ